MKTYKVDFNFIEDGRECHTSWTGPAASRDDAISKSRKWFGFEQDGIAVTKTDVTEMN